MQRPSWQVIEYQNTPPSPREYFEIYLFAKPVVMTALWDTVERA